MVNLYFPLFDLFGTATLRRVTTGQLISIRFDLNQQSTAISGRPWRCQE
jgi:hypothetical protein